mmetsp:Transcript_9535/g.12891  ORF Transcript_9535/g.12891 Transcript_9535/m.12891 type:complete len:126 (-) Transcript_9535:55-432(-)
MVACQVRENSMPLWKPWWESGKQPDKESAQAATTAVMTKMVKYLGEKKFLTGDNVTWPDFIFFEQVDFVNDATDGKFFEENSNVKAYYERMLALNGVSELYNSWTKKLPYMPENFLHHKFNQTKE